MTMNKIESMNKLGLFVMMFVFFILIILSMFDPIKMITNALNCAKEADAASQRIFHIFDYPVENFKMESGCFNNIIFKPIKFSSSRNPTYKITNDFTLRTRT